MPVKPSPLKLGLLLAALLSAAPGYAADLLQLYHDALSYDAQYAAARATAAAGREKEPQALAGLLPNHCGDGQHLLERHRLQGQDRQVKQGIV
jgi:outer membrane protein